MLKVPNTERFCKLGQAVIETELRAVAALSSRIGQSFVEACELILACQGRIVVIGMGKSGHIGGKIAATFASTGTPAFFVHPGEANHGDMGMITQKDVVLAISYSGETSEIVNLLPYLRKNTIPVIALCSERSSSLGQCARVLLDTSVDKEACPLGLAPTSSTTVTLVMGDALAVALLEQRGFTSNDFARFHPSGRLGRRLLLRIDDIMYMGDNLPKVGPGTTIKEALIEVSQKRFGMTTVVDVENHILGVFTDGDLRRTLDSDQCCLDMEIQQVMTRKVCSVKPGLLAVEALCFMQEKKISVLIVANDKNQLVGLLHMYDLLRAGVG